MKHDCTFLLSTYDGGEDLWEGFFKALSVQWPEMDMPIVLNTETKTYSYPGYKIVSYQSSLNKKETWAERIISVLKKINTEFIILFLEDFWLDSKVDHEFFLKTLNWMKEHKDVANFSFYPCLPGSNINDNRFERFEKRPQSCEYKFNCQVGLWRTKELISYFRPHETPWEWEVYGSKRASRCNKSFYSLKENAPKIFSYGDNLKGCIVCRGKWVKDQVLPLAEKYNLQIDYSIRGFYGEPIVKRNNPIKEFLKKYFYASYILGLYYEFYYKFYNKYREWLSVRYIKNQL